MPRVLSVFGERRAERRFQRGVYLLPSMFTVGNMFCGWACVVYAMRGDYATAAPFVAFAMILDTLDGRIARATGATSEFGEEFDSLADVISFGVAPATLGVLLGPRVAGETRVGSWLLVRDGHGHAPGPLQHPDKGGPALLPRAPEPGCGRGGRLDGLCLPERSPGGVRGGRGTGRHGGPRRPDGQPHQVPQLQRLDTPAGATRISRCC